MNDECTYCQKSVNREGAYPIVVIYLYEDDKQEMFCDAKCFKEHTA